MDRQEAHTRIAEQQLPDHLAEKDYLPETGTPAGTAWRNDASPPPGSRSGGADGFSEAPAAAGSANEPGEPTANFTEPERKAVEAASAGERLSPGDLREESEYEEARDRGTGGEQALNPHAGGVTPEPPAGKEGNRG
jgi:hypothetical protein